MTREIVISLCDRTGNMVKPWAEAGYLCYCVDLQHPEGETRDGNIIKVGASVLDWMPPRGEIVAAFAFPPCTDLAVSGAAHFKRKGLTRLIQALTIVDGCRKVCEWTGAPWFLENPVSTISSYWRKPDFMFDPYQYAGYLDDPTTDTYTKKTCLWTGGGFVMPEVRPVNITHTPGKSPLHMLPPSADRANLRSVTPMGFAKAVFEANAPVTTPAPTCGER